MCIYNPWVRTIPWRREWQPTPVFLPGEIHGHRGLTGYSPWGHKELDMTEQLTLMILTVYVYICMYISEKAMAPHSSTLAWKIPWMEEPGRLQSMELLRVRHD